MKLLVLSESANHVSCRYRVRAFDAALNRAGWEITVRPLARSSRNFVSVLRHARQNDVVLLQRHLLSATKLVLLRRYASRLIYDFDDAMFLRDSNSSQSAESWQRRRRFQSIVATADAVIAGNGYLAACAAPWLRRGRVEMIPTCVDPEAYSPIAHEDHRHSLRVAWIGSRSTLPSLNEITGALQRATRVIPGLELHVICDRAPEMPGVRTVLRPWSPESEARHLSECDVGISWLPNHLWSGGKCGLKVLQYMAAGLPVIANAVGIHREILSSDGQGILVHHSSDVCDALVRLANDPARRTQLGQGGRQRVETAFSVKGWSDRFVDVIRRQVGAPGIRT